MNIGAANHMDTFGKRILPQVIQEIRFSACAAVNFGLVLMVATFGLTTAAALAADPDHGAELATLVRILSHS